MTATRITAKEAIERLGESRTTVYNLCATGVLEKVYIGKGTRNFRITIASIERYEASQSHDPIEVAP